MLHASMHVYIVHVGSMSLSQHSPFRCSAWESIGESCGRVVYQGTARHHVGVGGDMVEGLIRLLTFPGVWPILKWTAMEVS